jgi:membrane-bound lytic murein transglycosylase B
VEVRSARSSAPGAAGTAGIAGAAIISFLGLGGWMLSGLLTFSEPNVRPLPPTGGESAAIEAAPHAPTASVDESSAPSMPARSTVSTTDGTAARVSEAWAIDVSARTGIPLRALLGYAGAELAMNEEAPECRIGWATLAAIGHLESGHGTHAGSSLDVDGFARPPILGPDLDGIEYERIDDTDGGRLDGSSATDRAAGPMQFIPSTWQQWGADGNGDRIADPQQIDDASLAAARYLCEYGDLSDPGAWRTAIFAYNHLESYVQAVSDAANEYARAAAG